MNNLRAVYYGILIIIFCLSLQVAVDGQNDFRTLDRHAQKAPDELNQNLPALVDYLIEPVSTSLEKVRVLYVWIIHHIDYDEDAYQKDVKRINQNNADILRRKRAVCFGYALLFQAMCERAGLEAVVVSGYSKGTLTARPVLEEADHAWNAVRIEDEWYLLDATWGSSLIDKKNRFVQQKEELYFLTPPKLFVQTHLPNLPMWQLLDCPVPPATFQQPPAIIDQYLDSAIASYTYQDSIQYFLALDPSLRPLWEAEGTYRFNPTTTNREHLGHSLLDYAGVRSDLAEKLQEQPVLADSLMRVQQEIIGLCERAFLWITPYNWQKELYINTLLNQAVAIYQYADGLEDPGPYYEEALQLLDAGETMLEKLQEDSYFARYAKQQCGQIRMVIEEILER